MFRACLLLAFSMVGSVWAEVPNLAPLLKQFPHFEVIETRPTPVAGVWELLTRQGQIYYLSEDSDYLFAGELVSVVSKGSLTEQRRQGLRRSALARAPKDLLQFPAAAEQHRVTIVTDIDCGYCRRLHQQIDEYNRNGISVQYLLMPRAGLAGDSFRKARNAVCANDPHAAFSAAMAGEGSADASCENSLQQQFALAQQLGVNGTPTIVFDDGRVLPGYITPAQLAERLSN